MEREIKIREELRKARGPAAILAIGTANPANVVRQASYPDYYFQVTDSENMTLLKQKFKRMCDKTMIKKRHMYLTRDLLERNPSIRTYGAPSLDARQDILVQLVPELGKEAAMIAIQRWGIPKSKITHLICHSNSAIDMPGADYQITKLLGLQLGVKRIMLYHQGCYVGGTLLRVAKDIAENNCGSRVLVVCSEMTLGAFHGRPCEADLDSLLGQAIISDGAAALIVGADPDASTESPLFELVSSSETIVPDSDGALEGPLREMGFTFRISKSVPTLISSHTGKFLRELLHPLGVGGDWNSFFWAIHTGGRAILDQIEAELGLNHGKLEATRHVLAEYGNMGTASVFFVLDQLRRRRTPMEGAGRNEWGILFAYGAGLTLDAVLLRRFPADPIPDQKVQQENVKP